MISSTQEQTIKATYEGLKAELDARARRLGHGGVATVARVTGRAARTVRRGQQALTSRSKPPDAPRRLRRHGAGRTGRTPHDQQRLQALDARVEPTARGAPLSPRRWTWQRTRRLAKARGQQGHPGRHSSVGPLRKALPDSVPGTRQSRAGTAPPARNAPCASIKAPGKACQHRGQPVVSVDTKQKDLVGDGAHGGRASHPQGVPEPGRGHDCPDKHVGTVLPDRV
jgi:hypothetical protein